LILRVTLLHAVFFYVAIRACVPWRSARAFNIRACVQHSREIRRGAPSVARAARRSAVFPPHLQFKRIRSLEPWVRIQVEALVIPR
jgi:hypothetical protein